ncbi:MAG: hypothetical protein IT371_20120 [Deltaproteobacteria bacterium]|nr:hypothetical protein [Deltaproteobacteria bacterium]
MALIACAFSLGACLRLGFEPGDGGTVSDGAKGAPGDGTISNDLRSADARPADARPSDALSRTVVIGDNAGDEVRGRTLDDTIVLEQPDDTRGACLELRADGQAFTSSILLRFDLTTVPRPAKILRARLELWTDTGPDSDLGPNGGIDAYRLLELWQEGAACRKAGDASWNRRRPGTPWSGAGARGASRDATPVAGLKGPLALGARFVLELPPSLVDGWFARPETNFGLVIDGRTSDGLIAVSREGLDGRRPRLILELAP